jgi:hypothetical protein
MGRYELIGLDLHKQAAEASHIQTTCALMDLRLCDCL